jgi:excisionase family DNA binding protein
MELITADEVAELLRVSRNRIILMARRGAIPSLLIDGRIRFDASEIQDWIRMQRGNGD